MAAEQSYKAVNEATDADDDRGALLSANAPRGSAGREVSTIFAGQQQEEEDLASALPRGMMLAVFICLYSGCSLHLLNSAEHLPRYVIDNPKTMGGLADFLVGGGLVILAALVVLMCVTPDMRPELTCAGIFKPNRIAGYLMQFSVVAMMLSLPYVIFLIYEVKHFRPQDTAWFVAFIFTLLTVLYSLREIVKHLQNFSLPKLQTNICRILLMAPVYAVACFLQLRLLQQGVYIGAIRELYEAFTVYSFMHLMTDFMERLAAIQQPPSSVVALINGPNGAGVTVVHHKFPVSLLENAGWISPWEMQSPDGRSSPFITKAKQGVLQYVPVAVFCAVMASVLEAFGGYHEAKISLRYGWFYLCFLRNFSQFVALYSLVMFYNGAKKLLQPLSPLHKFLSIKLIIFFTFWQKIILIGLKHWDMLPVHSLYADQYADLNTTRGVGVSTWGDEITSQEQFNELASAGIQNLLITIEMFLAALAHRQVFSYKIYQKHARAPETGSDARKPFASALSEMVDFGDAITEIDTLVGTVAGEVQAQFSLDQITSTFKKSDGGGGGGGEAGGPGGAAYTPPAVDRVSRTSSGALQGSI